MVGTKKKIAIIFGMFFIVGGSVFIGIKLSKTDDANTYQLEDEKLKNTLAECGKNIS